MDCRAWCVLEGFLVGVVVGAATFVLLAVALCLLGELLVFAGAIAAGGAVAGPGGAAAGAGAAVGINLALLWPCIVALVAAFWIPLAIIAVFVGLVAWAIYYSECAADCGAANVAAGATAETTQAIGATVGDLTCAGARDSVDQLERQAAAARAAREAQRERVARARRRLRTARRARVFAVATVAATALWNLIALAAAVAALFAATAAVAFRRAQVGAMEAALAALDAALAALEGALAVAQAVAEKACRDDRPGGGFEPRPIGELPGGFGTVIGQGG